MAVNRNVRSLAPRSYKKGNDPGERQPFARLPRGLQVPRTAMGRGGGKLDNLRQIGWPDESIGSSSDGVSFEVGATPAFFKITLSH